MDEFDAVVIGAGQSGLAASHHLARRGVDHAVLERATIGDTWISQRWDTFKLNTPGWSSRLPDDDGGPAPADEFATRDAFVAYLRRYADMHRLPMRTGVNVTAVEFASGGGFVVTADGSEPIRASAVVVASGSQRMPRIPAEAASVPASVTQIHSVAYRNPDGLPRGGVLVVGSAQSGGQITEDLLEAGRIVHLATSRVARVPRRHRGRDCFHWLGEIGFWEQTVAMLPNPAMHSWPQPIISGVGRYGHTLSLQYLAERGAHLLGRFRGAEDGRLRFADDLGANVAWADERSAAMVRAFDEWIARNGVDAPPAEIDEADRPHWNPAALHAPETLDLDDAGISTVIWTTGLRGDYSWLPPTAVAGGVPIQTGGLSPMPGLYFLGLPWQRNRASAIMRGAGADAASVADHLAGSAGA